MAITTVGRSYKRKPKEKGPCKLSDKQLAWPFFFLSALSPAWSAGRPGLRLPSNQSLRAGGRFNARQELPLPARS